MRSILFSLVTILFVGGMLTGATRAVFSSQNPIPDNRVASGQVTIGTVMTSKPLRVTKLFPGQSTTWAWVDISNTSGIPLDYSVYLDNASGDAALWNVLKIELVKVLNPGGGDGQAICAAGSTIFNDIVGNAYQAGNRRGIFTNVATSETVRLCQRVYLDGSVDNGASNKSTAFDEIIFAEQNGSAQLPNIVL